MEGIYFTNAHILMRRDFALIRNFMMLYSLKLPDHPIKREAYEATEAVWIGETGSRFYRNYNSFNASRNHYHKARRLYHVTSLRRM